MAKLVWIAGYPKSGTTWLRLFLHAYLGGRAGINCLGSSGDRGDLNRQLYEAVSPIPLDEVKADDSIYLRTAALFALSLEQYDQFVKTHCARRVINGVDLIPVDLTKGALYVVRDPRDVSISLAHHMDKTIDEAIEMMETPTTLYKDNLTQYIGDWSQNVEHWMKTPFPTLVVPYENMLSGVAWPHVCHFVTGKDLNSDRLQFAITSTSFSLLKEQEKSEEFKERSPKADNFFRAGRSTWREVLTDEQVARIENAHKDVMDELGYERTSQQ